MKKVININFQGRVVMIEETAYENLKQYIDSLRIYFANEEGRDEIINDIEWRVSELFEEIIKKGEPCVTENHLESIIKSIGRPQDLQQEEEIYQAHATTAAASAATAATKSPTNEQQTAQKTTQQQTHTNFKKRFLRDETNKRIGGVCAGIGNYLGIDHSVVRILTVLFAFAYGVSILVYIVLWAALPGATTKEIGSSYRKLFRDPTSKVIGGVCSGLAHYFKMETWIVRLIFILSLLSPAIFGILDFGVFSGSLSGFTFLLYLVLWIVVPKANRPTDFLAMRGENIDLNNIKNTVQEDMSDDKKKIVKSPATEENSNQMNYIAGQPQQNYTYTHNSTGFGDVILIIIKAIAYVLLGIIVLSLLGALIAIGIAAIVGLPYLNLYFTEGWQSTIAVLAVVCFIWVPVIAISIWIIRRLLGYKHKNGSLRNAFLMLWLVGVAATIALVVSGYNNIKYESELNRQAVTLTNPGVDKLIVDFTSGNKNILKRNFRVFPFRKNDKFYINNMYLDIEKSTDSNYHAYIQKYANGNSIADANKYAEKINLPFTQKDSVLHIEKGILINAANKFRNQKADITIEVPVGKTIYVNNNYFGFPNVEIANFRWKKNREWSSGKEYIMTDEGLKPVNNNETKTEIKINTGDDISVKIETENGTTKYYINDEEVDSTQYEEALKKLNTQKDSTQFNNI